MPRNALAYATLATMVGLQACAPSTPHPFWHSPNLWTRAESAAVLTCLDSLHNGTAECRNQLADGFLRVSAESSGELRLARFWPVNGYQLDSAFGDQERRLVRLLGPPTDTVQDSHVSWRITGSWASLWQHGPDVEPVDSSQALWAVILFQGSGEFP